jgi:catechol 2,3-dioxygenase-like lactoylglutathione lyase family enzyme
LNPERGRIGKRRSEEESKDVTDKGIDIGVCIGDSQTALRFYRDTIGLEHVTDLELPQATMHRLRWGTSLVKLIRPHEPPTAPNQTGGLVATGIRYFTLTVQDLDATMARCEAGGYTTVSPAQEFRPGIRHAVVEDPEGKLG